MATDMHKLSMYLSDTWKMIFQGIDQSISHAGTNFTLVSYDGKDFLRDSVGEDGKIDSGRLCLNIGKIIECEPIMKERLLSELEKSRVTFAAVEAVEQEGDKAFNKCYFAIDHRDRHRAASILEDLNRSGTEQMKPADFLALCEKKNLGIRGISQVEPEIFETMQMGDRLGFTFCAMKNRDGTYDIRVPILHEKKLQQAVTAAVVLCSAHTRDAMLEHRQEYAEAITEAITKITDSRKAYLIADSRYPEHYIRTDTTGLHNIVHTKAGDRELDFIQRTDLSFQSKAYNILAGYSGYEIIPAGDKEAAEQLEALRMKARQGNEPDLNIKTEYYKRSMAEQILEVVEGDYTGRLKDNEVRFRDAIDHTVVLGAAADTLKGDLQGDLQLNDRAIAGYVKESSIDLSDLNGEAFVQRFCQEVLMTKEIADDTRRKTIEEEIVRNTRVRELAAEAPAVKTAVINEVHQTIDEVRTVHYELEDIDRGVLKQEIKAKENVFEEIRMDMEEHEY